MPFTTRTLLDGRKIPEIGFGTWKVPTDVCAGYVEQAIDVSFDHIDTAQTYRNETETGTGIKESGLSRKDIWVTTKWSGTDGKGVRQSCMESLEKLNLKYVDLYLIHSPRLCKGDIAGCWKEMEDLKKEGFCKSIGVSNFEVDDLKVLLASCRVRPVVNQILLHPYVIAMQEPLLELMAEYSIIPEGYSSLIPLTSKPGGPVDKPVAEIGERLKAKPEQVLLAWSRAKGAIIVTTSSKKERLESYLAVGDIELTAEDIAAIDKAGKKGAVWDGYKVQALKVAKLALGAGVGFQIAKAVRYYF